MSVLSGLNEADAAKRISLDDNGLFTYQYDSEDRFDISVAFEAVVNDETKSQLVTIRTNEIQSEFELVAEPGELPDATDYVVVSEEILGGHFFNTQERQTRRIEISGKRVHLIPEDKNGLFERFVYHQGTSTNADIQELAIYAETVVIGGKVRLPGTDVTIFAKELIFEDNDDAQIDTTPLSYTFAAANARILPPPPGSHLSRTVLGENGNRGQDAGNVLLRVDSLQLPNDRQRFVLRGGSGQEAGAGLPGQHGESRPVIRQEDGRGTDFFAIARVLHAYPNATYIQWNDIFQNPSTRYGSRSFPTDGRPAIAGGRPGTGGTGGRLVSQFDMDSIADVSGGSAGRKAANQSGGRPGTPRTAYHIEIPVIGSWGVNSRDSSFGRGWTAPGGSAGSVGRAVQIEEQNASDWLHPSGMRAMISYAKDAYLNGHNDLAAELFNQYGHLLDEALLTNPGFVSQFQEIRTEVATFEHQLANQLDYFGNPQGWAPTLSFAANYRAFQSAIDSDLKTLFLTRLVQRADAEQETKLASLTRLIGELDESIDHATAELNDAQERLPDLQGELQDIVSETQGIQNELTVLEERLESRAEASVSARNVLNTIGGLLSVVPIPTVSAIGGGLTSLNSFIADPTLGGFASAAKGLADPFKQATLDASSAEISEQLAELKRPSDPDASLTDYGAQLGRLAAKWAPVVAAYQEVTDATQVPSDEIEAELQRLKAGDSEYRNLVGRLERLLAKKQEYATELAQTIHAISANLNEITSSYAAADTLNRQLGVESERSLGHATLDRVHAMERSARDRLVRYQYNLAKAYEYETLQPYEGDLRLQATFDEIVDLLTPGSGEQPEPSFLDTPGNFEALQSIYESELRGVADQIWTKLTNNAPERTSEIKLSLSAEQLSELNNEGEVTINLIEEGFIDASRQDVKLLQMGIERVQSEISDAEDLQAANVQFRFEHSGSSIVQANGSKYVFQHVTGDNDTFFWSTDYDAIGGELVQSEVSPSALQAVSALLQIDDLGGTLSPYAHPGVWSDITIRTATDIVPSGASVELEQLTLFVKYDSDLPQANRVLLDVRTPEEISPRVLLDSEDGRDSAHGSFTRFYGSGTEVMLTAEPRYGNLRFTGWLNDRGEKLGEEPTLFLSLAQNMQLSATYERFEERLPGDANGDGEVDIADFLILSRNFGRANDVAFADGDFDTSGTVDVADFLILARAFATSRNR